MRILKVMAAAVLLMSMAGCAYYGPEYGHPHYYHPYAYRY